MDSVDEQFETHIAPARNALRDLLLLADDIGYSSGQVPAADSRAMKEIAEQFRFNGDSPWGNDPVQAAHAEAQLLLLGANDSANSMARLLSSDPTPLYAHTVLARSALEHAGRSWWLMDPEIGVKRRVARGMNERIFALTESSRLPLDDERRRAQKRRTALLDIGVELGFRKVRDNKKRPALDEQRPGQTEIIRKLLATGDDRRLGQILYGFFSAVAHGTLFGLSNSVKLDAPEVPKIPGFTFGGAYTRSSEVVIVLSAVLIGLGEAIDRRNKLFGWQSADWSKSWLQAINVASRLLPRT
jgi:hypothetical protein